MNADSELSVEHAADGMRVRLDSGSVIVTAAKQRRGHLYVETRDLLISVVEQCFR
jgi:ferric-dicitrate binding protein FerR (iron transport regulator)